MINSVLPRVLYWVILHEPKLIFGVEEENNEPKLHFVSGYGSMFLDITRSQAFYSDWKEEYGRLEVYIVCLKAQGSTRAQNYLRWLERRVWF